MKRQSKKNKERGERMAEIFKAYDAEHDETSANCGMETVLTDFLTDLRHWADTHKVNFDAANRGAESHHYAETKNPAEPAAAPTSDAVLAFMARTTTPEQ